MKIYLSLKPEYLYQGANLVFNYLSIHKIKHASKIGKDIRNDNIVIRVYDLDDAKKLISYINNNYYLKTGTNDISPFCFRNGLVGLAVDNYHSYNVTISSLLYQYITFKKNNNQLATVSCQDLCNFVSKYDVAANFAKGNHQLVDQIEDIPYIKEIQKLFISSLSSSDLLDFEKHYYSVIKNSKLNNSYNNALKDLACATIGTAEKYQQNQAIIAIFKYILNGDLSGFTREELHKSKCRDLLIKYDYRTIRQQIIKIALDEEMISYHDVKNIDYDLAIKLANYFYQNFCQKKHFKK